MGRCAFQHGAAGGAPPRAMRLICKGKAWDDNAMDVRALAKRSGAKLMLMATAAAADLRRVGGVGTGGAGALRRRQQQKRKAAPAVASAPMTSAEQLAARAVGWRKTGVVSVRDEGTVALPVAVWEVGAAARTLDAGGNPALERLPAEGLRALCGLQRLRLSGCGLTAHGVPWDALPATLESLLLDANALEGALPAAVGTLRALRVLDVSHNALTSLPDAIGGLAKMSALRADDNRLTELPMAMCACGALEELRVADNDLAALPAELGRCALLAVVAADGNGRLGVDGVPTTLLRAPRLHSLTLHGCSATAEQLRELSGWGEYDARRRARHSARLEGGVVGDNGLDEGVDAALHRRH